MRIAVRVQVAGHELRLLVRPGDEHPRVGRDRRQRGAAAVEEHEVGPELAAERLAPAGDVRRRTARPASPPPARRQPTVGTPASAAVSR